MTDETHEKRYLDHHPEIRSRISSDPEFQKWRRGLQSVQVDGREYFIRGGDMLVDEDQVIVEWARRLGLINTGEP